MAEAAEVGVWPTPAYPAHSHLHDGIKAPLRGVQVPRDLLLAHQRVELLAIAGQLEDVFIAEWTGAVLVACARVQQLGRGSADVWHDSLFHKRTKAFAEQAETEILFSQVLTLRKDEWPLNCFYGFWI